MTTSKGILTTLVVVSSAIAAFVGVAPLAVADDEAAAPGTTAGASTKVTEADSQEDGSPIVEEAVQAQDHQGTLHKVSAPAAVNSTSVGYKGGQVSPNRIDTSNKEAVRRAFAERYLANDVQIQPAAGADSSRCLPGHVNAEAADRVVAAWNFFRGMNNLDAVVTDPASPASDYVQKAALTQAAENNYGSHHMLSHHPHFDNFKCGDLDANVGAANSNLAQANGFGAAEQIQWWYQDWSGNGSQASTMHKEGINDILGHRNWLMDPFVRETAYGNVEGYNALLVGTGTDFDRYEGLRTRNPNATAPQTMSWPSAGYFPAELLTSTTAHELYGAQGNSSDADVERWSFRVKGADMSNARVSVTGPHGNVPVRVVSRGDYAPREISGYGTVLFKMSNADVYAPHGTNVSTFTVRVWNVKNASQSSYYYQVKLFNASATLAAPTLSVSRNPIAIEGATTVPARINATGANNSYQWQISADKGQSWSNATHYSNLYEQGVDGKPTSLFWAPTVDVCETKELKYSCPLSAYQVENYRFRLRATNKYGTAYTPALKADFIHFANTPSSIRKGQQLSAHLSTSGNGDFVSVSSQVIFYANGHYIGKNSVSTNVNASKVEARVSVRVFSTKRSYLFIAKKQIALR